MLQDENEDLEILRDYTKAGCEFECMLDFARDACGCTPWNFPHPPGEGLSLMKIYYSPTKNNTVYCGEL